MVSEPHSNWKAEAVSVAMKQGPSFVILCMILYGIYYFGDYTVKEAVPAWLKQIHLGYEDLDEKHQRDLVKFRETQDKFLSSWESQLKQGQTQITANRDAAKALQSLAEEVEKIVKKERENE